MNCNKTTENVLCFMCSMKCTINQSINQAGFLFVLKSCFRIFSLPKRKKLFNFVLQVNQDSAVFELLNGKSDELVEKQCLIETEEEEVKSSESKYFGIASSMMKTYLLHIQKTSLYKI